MSATSQASSTERNSSAVALEWSMAAVFAIISVLAITKIVKSLVESNAKETRFKALRKDLAIALHKEIPKIPSTTVSRFLDLPPELRLAVYAHFTPAAPCACAGKYLRRVCRQVQVEFDSEVARQMSIHLNKSITSAPVLVQWKVHTCNSPLLRCLPVSILSANEYYDMHREKWPDASNSLTYRLLSALPACVKAARITFENDAKFSEWSASYQIQKVKSAISSFMVDSKQDNKCDLKTVEMYWGAMVRTKAGRKGLATDDRRLLVKDFWIKPDVDRRHWQGYAWNRKTFR